MFCPHCGFENSEDIRFCANCGKDVKESLEITFTPSGGVVFKPIEKTLINNNEPSQKDKEKKQKPPKVKKEKDYSKTAVVFKKASVIALIALILSLTLSVGSLAWYFASGNKVYTDEPLTPPVSQALSEPTYDIAKITKTAMNEPAPGSAATAAQAKEITTAINAIEAAIDEGKKKAKEDNPKLEEDDYTAINRAIMQKLYELYQKDAIQDYEILDYNISIELNNGMLYIYTHTQEGTLSGTSGALRVATYQPNLSTAGKDYTKYSETVDTAALSVPKAFPLYSFTEADNLDNDEVSLSALFATTGYNLVIWEGHGGYTSEAGAYIATGIPNTEENRKIYYEYLEDRSLIMSKDNLLLTAEFINNHINDGAYENTIVYLGSCNSAQGDELASAFINKGAEAVYANTGKIHTEYNAKMINSVTEALCTKNTDGKFNNVKEALSIAKDKNSDYDTGECSSTYVTVFTENDDFSLDWYEDNKLSERQVVLLLDNSCSMEGSPFEEILTSAYSFGASMTASKTTVSIVTYGEEAKALTGFTSRNESLQEALNTIECDGYSVNIQEGLKAAEELFEKSTATNKIIVLMTDGLPNEGLTDDDLIAYANSVKAKDIDIYALCFTQNHTEADKTQAHKLMSSIASAGCYRNISNINRIADTFKDTANEISGARSILIQLTCPGDIEISYNNETLSLENPVTSFGTLSFEGIPAEDESDDEADGKDSGEKSVSTAKTIRLVEGPDYTVVIKGKAKGELDYTVSFMDENSQYSDTREFKNIKITKNTVIEGKAIYSATTTLSVNEDGDEKADFVYRVQKGEKAEKIHLNKLDWRIIVTIVCACVALVALVVFIIAKKGSKPTKSKAV